MLLARQSPLQFVILVSKLMPLSSSGSWLATKLTPSAYPVAYHLHWNPFRPFFFVARDDPCHCPMFGWSLLLLLAGDVSTNPGPAVHKLNFRLGTVNARSMRNKAAVLSDLVVSQRIDLLGITETWLTARETSADLAEVTPPGFSFFQIPRAKRRGGGSWPVRLVCLQIYPHYSIPAHISFESISGNIELGQSCLNILNIYRQPGPTSTFFGEFLDILSYMSTLPHDLVVMGDFNLHVDTSSSDVRQFADILESLIWISAWIFQPTFTVILYRSLDFL